jgi:hypothetical protein
VWICEFREKKPDAARRLLQDVAELHREGHIAPRIAARFPMDRHAEAFAVAQDRNTGEWLLTEVECLRSRLALPFPMTASGQRFVQVVQPQWVEGRYSPADVGRSYPTQTWP